MCMRSRLNTQTGWGRANVPKLFLKVEPCAIVANDTLVNLVRGWPALAEKDGGGDQFRSGRFAGRDRADHRRLDVEVVERTYLEIPARNSDKERHCRGDLLDRFFQEISELASGFQMLRQGPEFELVEC